MRGKEKMKKQLFQPRAMKKVYAFTEKRPIDLSLSENPLGCSPLVFRAMRKLRTHFNDYPSPNGKKLKKKLSQKFALNENNFFVANGSESIIQDLPKVFCTPVDEVLIPELTFPMFAICSELSGARVILIKMTDVLGIDLSKIFESISQRTKMIFLCNPNNPTGSVLPKAEIIKFIKNVPKNILVVVDEANIEFGGESVVREVVRHTHLVVLRTFSKGFGLANLRVGFAVADEKIIRKLEEETPIFQVSGLSEQLACVALEDDDFLQKTKRVTKDQRLLLKRQLVGLGCVVFPSEANNLFVKLPSFLSADQFGEQLEKRGVSVVLGSNFTGFDDSFFRVSVRDEQTNKIFIQKMKEIITVTPQF